MQKNRKKDKVIFMLRIGEVSSVNKKERTIRVLYSDMDESVSGDIMCLEKIGVPKVEDTVAVLCNDDGEGVCLGKVCETGD